MSEPRYANIRDFLGSYVGARLVDVTQQDREEFDETGEAYVMLHFDNGLSMRFVIGDGGFDSEEPDDAPAADADA